jgi:transcription antitermination factor NusG
MIEHHNKSPKFWYAIKTKFKTEKFVVDQITKKGIEAYIPLIHITKRYSKKIKKLKLPLINNYAFVKITEQDRLSVLQTEYVFNFVGMNGKMECIPDHEINLLKQIVGEFEEKVSISAIEWQIGEDVEIISGSLTGIRGKLVKKAGKNNFVVELTSIGIELQMEIEIKFLKKISLVA